MEWFYTNNSGSHSARHFHSKMSNTVSFSMVMELQTLHIMLYVYTRYQAWVFINSHISADMQFGTRTNSSLTCGFGCGGTCNSWPGLLRLILLKFCGWGYLKNMMHECKLNTGRKMLQDSWMTQTSEVALHGPWPKKSECASTLLMVTQSKWVTFQYKLIMSEKWTWLSNIHSSTFWVRPMFI
jgi:hypothetical protein